MDWLDIHGGLANWLVLFYMALQTLSAILKQKKKLEFVMVPRWAS